MGRRLSDVDNEDIESILTSLKATVDVMPKERKADWHKLNELFLELIQYTGVGDADPT